MSIRHLILNAFCLCNLSLFAQTPHLSGPATLGNLTLAQTLEAAKINAASRMSQQELADIALDGNAGYMSRIINGNRRCISLPIAIKIAQALNRPVEEVFIYKTNTEKK